MSPGMDGGQKRLQRVDCCVFATYNLTRADLQLSDTCQLNECAPLFRAVGCRGGTRNFITIWSRQVKYRSECGPGLPGHSVLWLKRGHSGNRCLGNGSQQCNCLQSETISGWTFHLVYSCLPRLFLKCVSFPTIVDSPILYKLDVL